MTNSISETHRSEDNDMNREMRDLLARGLAFLEKHSLLVAAAAIYGYYLFTSMNLFEHSEVKKTFFDYLLQFDSLIFMWVIAVVVVQLQKYRKENRDQEEHRKNSLLQFERQRVQLEVLDDITELLQDSVNSPLTAISIATQSIRRRFEFDEEVLTWLDRIETSMQRVQAGINEIKSQRLQNIVKRTI
jgi:signal transduction histidine kinase